MRLFSVCCKKLSKWIINHLFIIPQLLLNCLDRNKVLESFIRLDKSGKTIKCPENVSHRNNKVVIKMTWVLLFIFDIWPPVLRKCARGSYIVANKLFKEVEL